MLVMLMIIMVTYYQSAKIINENNSSYISQSMYQINQEISDKYDTFEKMMVGISFNEITQDFIYNEKPGNRFDNISKLISFLKAQLAVDDAIIDICIIPENESALDVIGIKDYLGEMTKGLAIGKTIYYTGLGKVKLSTGSIDINTILLVSNIYPGANRNSFGTPIGIVILALDTSRISKNINNMDKMTGTDFFLTDKNGIVISSNNKKRIGQKFDAISGAITMKNNQSSSKIEGTEYYIYQEPTRFGGKILSIVPIDQLLQRINTVRAMDLIMVFVCIIILVIPLSLILKNIVNPLRKVSAFMNDMMKGNLKMLQKRITVNGHAEVREMADSFNRMLNELDLLTHRLLETNTRLYELEITEKQMELAFLQSQINPHFLYNTLESIKGIALYKKIPEIRDMAQALSEIFRYSIKGGNTVTFSEEIEILKSFVYIQEIRFTGRFVTEYQISEDTLDCIVPKMILQPIAENAIYHGLEMSDGEGLLMVRSEIIQGQILEITIEDNGVGVDDGSLLKITSLLGNDVAQTVDSGNKRIGIGNVHNRIRLQYGPQYGLSMQSGQGLGMKVTYHIPVERVNHV